MSDQSDDVTDDRLASILKEVGIARVRVPALRTAIRNAQLAQNICQLRFTINRHAAGDARDTKSLLRHLNRAQFLVRENKMVRRRLRRAAKLMRERRMMPLSKNCGSIYEFFENGDTLAANYLSQLIEFVEVATVDGRTDKISARDRGVIAAAAELTSFWLEATNDAPTFNDWNEVTSDFLVFVDRVLNLIGPQRGYARYLRSHKADVISYLMKHGVFTLTPIMQNTASSPA